MTAPAPNPSLQTIADRAGVSRAAVSLALRNQPGISVATRERIQKIAEEAGYRPNPMVAALMAHLKGLQPSKDVASIPFLTAHSTRHGWRSYSTFVRYYNGASERAQQMGYHLDEMWLREPGINARKLKSILLNRGIQGILIGPLPKGLGHISLDLGPFSVATVGHSLVRPKIHRAVCRHIESLRMAVHNMRHLGYRRIAMVISEMQDRRNDFNWTTAYAGYQQTLPQRDRIPIFFLDHSDDDKFAAWLEKWQPEAILSGNLVILEKLAKSGVSVPGDVGVAILDRAPSDEGAAGIDQQFEAVGAAAVDIIVGQINRNERGVPPTPQLIMTDGVWVPGNTLRKIERKVPAIPAKARPQRPATAKEQSPRKA